MAGEMFKKRFNRSLQQPSLTCQNQHVTHHSLQIHLNFPLAQNWFWVKRRYIETFRRMKALSDIGTRKKSMKIVLQRVLSRGSKHPAAFNNHRYHQQSISQQGRSWSTRCQGVYLWNIHSPWAALLWELAHQLKHAHTALAHTHKHLSMFSPTATAQQSPL